MNNPLRSNSNQSNFFHFILKICYNEDDRKKAMPNLSKKFSELFKYETEIDYPAIFDIVSQSSITLSDLDIILEIISEIEKQIEDESLKRLLRKMGRHFRLSFAQKNYFEVLQSNYLYELSRSQEALDATQAELAITQEDLKDIQGKNKEIKNEITNIYAQFITILGIFTAIVLSVFGGLQILSSAFQNLQSTPTWKVVMIGSIFSIAVLSMLFLLTRWVSTIVFISFGIKREKSLVGILANNGAFATGVFIFSYLIFAAVIFSSSDFYKHFKQLLSLADFWPILILLAVPLVIWLALFIKIIGGKIHKKNY
ncbi:hypothetical protein RST01_20950 [Rummeliibacillus stabekisii]|nr:hypothetical protein RST01_20950 [Rummeliibacillus stabekisii]